MSALRKKMTSKRSSSGHLASMRLICLNCTSRVTSGFTFRDRKRVVEGVTGVQTCALPIYERIAKEDDVEEVFERPSGIHEIDMFELHKPGDFRLHLQLAQHVVFAAEEVFLFERRNNAYEGIRTINCPLSGGQDLGVDIG